MNPSWKLILLYFCLHFYYTTVNAINELRWKKLALTYSVATKRWTEPLYLWNISTWRELYSGHPRFMHFCLLVEVELCPQKGHSQVLTPAPVSVTLFWNRVFTSVIKWRWGHIGSSPMPSGFIRGRRGRGGHGDTEM